MEYYGDALYGHDTYSQSSLSLKRQGYVKIRARIARPPVQESPPVIDTIVRGLAQRFDFLQQGIQAFSMLNKIEYATGKEDSIVPSLDSAWGRIFHLPRLTGESDDDYRKRLQTHCKSLVGSGTIPVCQEIIDFLIGMPGQGVTKIYSLWPARAMITFTTGNALWAARSKLSLLNTVLPGLFAAGVEYIMHIPATDYTVSAVVQGDAEMSSRARAAVRGDVTTTFKTVAGIADSPMQIVNIALVIAAIRTSFSYVMATIRAERDRLVTMRSAIQGNPELFESVSAAICCDLGVTYAARSAICSENSYDIRTRAAIAKPFDVVFRIGTMVTYSFMVESTATAIIRAQRDVSVKMRARIAKRVE